MTVAFQRMFGILERCGSILNICLQANIKVGDNQEHFSNWLLKISVGEAQSLFEKNQINLDKQKTIQTKTLVLSNKIFLHIKQIWSNEE